MDVNNELNEAYQAGWDEGYQAGYEAGQRDMENYITYDVYYYEDENM